MHNDSQQLALVSCCTVESEAVWPPLYAQVFVVTAVVVVTAQVVVVTAVHAQVFVHHVPVVGTGCQVRLIGRIKVPGDFNISAQVRH
jgi:hypothetical protein